MVVGTRLNVTLYAHFLVKLCVGFNNCVLVNRGLGVA